MKWNKYLFSCIFATIALSSRAQWDWNLSFDDTTFLSRVKIDTAANANNIWQIGKPGKTIFNAAYSPMRAIITDTLKPYPASDTSSFIIRHLRPGNEGGNWSLLLDFYYKINSDTLTDYGTIEASIDNGLSWVNLLTQDSMYGFYWSNPKPVLSGNSNGWKHFSENINMITYNLGYADTLLYRFTFVSDSIQTNKEGWMIDNFYFDDTWEGIEEFQNEDFISISPNPASDEINLAANFSDLYKIKILDLSGREVFSAKENSPQKIDVRQFENGIYFVRLDAEGKMITKKIIVQH